MICKLMALLKTGDNSTAVTFTVLCCADALFERQLRQPTGWAFRRHGHEISRELVKKVKKTLSRKDQLLKKLVYGLVVVAGCSQ